jgi:hypothetical protein
MKGMRMAWLERQSNCAPSQAFTFTARTSVRSSGVVSITFVFR